MRIGLIAPPWVTVPPTGYGGTEIVVNDLACTLSQAGHDVRLFTIGDSTCQVERRMLFQHAAEPHGFGPLEAAHVLAAYEDLADCDVIHDHTLLGPLTARTPHPPIVVTHHGPFDDINRRLLASVGRRASIVAISESHAREAGSVPIDAVVRHGIDLELYRTGAGASGRLLFIGRMSPDKGLHRAIHIARGAGMALDAVVKMREPVERAYYDEIISPLLGADVCVQVEPPLETKLALLRNAVALLNPITWPEPFGLVMLEALASGTPVLGFPQGAAAEIVTHGQTGYLCENEEALLAALANVDRIDRAACRRSVERAFSRERMAADYVEVYRRAIVAGRRRPQLVTRVLSVSGASVVGASAVAANAVGPVTVATR